MLTSDAHAYVHLEYKEHKGTMHVFNNYYSPAIIKY